MSELTDFMAQPPSNTSIIQSLISSNPRSAFVILLWAINKPAFNKIKARRQTVTEAYLTETHNYVFLSLSQGTNSHAKNRHFWHYLFQIYSHKFHKTVVPLLTFTPDTFSHYSVSTNQAGFFFPPDWFLCQTSFLVIDRLQYTSDYQVWQRESNLVNVRKREWLLSKQRQSRNDKWKTTEHCRLCFDSLWWWQIDS